MSWPACPDAVEAWRLVVEEEVDDCLLVDLRQGADRKVGLLGLLPRSAIFTGCTTSWISWTISS